jgi:hypothetical protein
MLLKIKSGTRIAIGEIPYTVVGTSFENVGPDGSGNKVAITLRRDDLPNKEDESAQVCYLLGEECYSTKLLDWKRITIKL